MEIKSIEEIAIKYGLYHSFTKKPDESALKAMEEYAQQFQEQAPTDVLTTEIMVLRERNEELAAWKESAMQVMNDLNLQAIGDELGFKLGSSIAPQILPAIKKLKELNSEMLNMLESRLIVLENCGMKSPKALIELITKSKEV